MMVLLDELGTNNMGILSSLSILFKGIGKSAAKAVQIAHKYGLDDFILDKAYEHIRKVDKVKNMTRDNKAIAVAAKLMDEFKIPYSVAKLAVELAYQNFKREKGN